MSVTIPAAARTDGKYLKVAVCVEYPTGNAWSTAYIQTSHLPFTDVPLNHWGYDAIRHCYESGYFAGTSDTAFSPDATMTRAMLAVVVHRMAGSPEPDDAVSLPFTDVAESAWYLDSVRWCYAEGIVAAPRTPRFRRTTASPASRRPSSFTGWPARWAGHHRQQPERGRRLRRRLPDRELRQNGSVLGCGTGHYGRPQ